MRQILLAVGTLLVLGLYQNCQPAVNFGQDSNSSNKAVGDLTTITDENEIIEIVEEVPVDTPNEGETAAETPVAETPVSEAQGDMVCILDGPGKSVKLAINEAGDLQGRNSVPRVLCMSSKACLEIASQAFTVKGPEKRGYCKPGGNKHVSHITDAELAGKILVLQSK